LHLCAVEFLAGDFGDKVGVVGGIVLKQVVKLVEKVVILKVFHLFRVQIHRLRGVSLGCWVEKNLVDL
jgi:hypothetical protein